jgi:hypothetical protein
MRNAQNGSGRLFSATIEGARPTLQDLMVAASVYVGNLEEAFPDAAQLISCYFAWERDEGPSGESYANEPELSLRWQKAHIAATGVARAWLSNPHLQTFRFRPHEITWTFHSRSELAAGRHLQNLRSDC